MRLGIFLLATRFPDRPAAAARHRSADEFHSDARLDAAALSRTVEAAVAAERAGFDDVWLAEHHFMSYGVVPSATLMAGQILAVTDRVHVGTAVSVLSTQHPVALAEQAAMLSLLSGGRFRLGVGRGGPWRDLEVFGTGLPRYEEGFAESLDLLLTWLRSDRVAWSGERFRFREVPVVPRAATPPPVIVACTSPPPRRSPRSAACRCCWGCTSDGTRRPPPWPATASRTPPTSPPMSPRSPTPAKKPSRPSWRRCRAGWVRVWRVTSPWTTVRAPPATPSPTRAACASCTRWVHRTTASSPW
ncbi:LLM class flavin-dependent oxidoreductase [Actinomadura welshii]